MYFLRWFFRSKDNPTIQRGVGVKYKKFPIKYPLFRIMEVLADIEDEETKLVILNNVRWQERKLILKLLCWAYDLPQFTAVKDNIILTEWVRYKGNQNFAVSDIYEEIRRLDKFRDETIDKYEWNFVASHILGGFEELPIKDAEILQAVIEGNFSSKIITPELADKFRALNLKNF